MCNMVSKMCGMVPKMCGVVLKMCSMVPKCATWYQKCVAWSHNSPIPQSPIPQTPKPLIPQFPNPLIPLSLNPPIPYSMEYYESLGATDRRTDGQGDRQTNTQELCYLDMHPCPQGRNPITETRPIFCFRESLSVSKINILWKCTLGVFSIQNQNQCDISYIPNLI